MSTVNGFSHHEAPDISPLEELIRKARRLLRSSWVAAGLAVTVGLSLTTLTAAALIDLAIPLGEAMRLVGLILVIGPALWVFGMGVVRPLFRRLTKRRVARRIEAHLPEIHNRIVSCVDLSQNEVSRAVSPIFYRRLLSEALARIRNFRPSQIVDKMSLRRATLFAGVGVLLLGVSWLTFSQRLPTALARLAAPFADIPPASGVVYYVHPGNQKVLRGEDVPFKVELLQGNPRRLRLEVKLTHNGKRQTVWHDMEQNEQNEWEFTLTGLQQSFDYRIHGGGTWSRRYHIEMVDRPQITAVRPQVYYPPYMGVTSPHTNPTGELDVSGPIGGHVRLAVDVEGAAEEGEIQFLQKISSPEEEAEFVVEKTYPLAISGQPQEAAGHIVQRWEGEFPLEQSGWYRVEMRNGLRVASQPMKEAKVTAVIDQPPQVMVERPGENLTVSEAVRVPLYIAAYDDYGLSDVVIAVRGGKSEGFVGRPVKRYERLRRSDWAIVTLDLAKEGLEKGQSLRYRVEVRDRKGQSAQTKDYEIKMADDPNAADQQLARYEQQQDTFREKLDNLIQQQEKIQQRVDQMEEKFTPLTEKIEAAQAEQEQPQKEAPDAKKTPPLDAEAQKALEQLRKQLAEAAAQQEKNAQLGQQAADELKKLADQAPNLQMLPPQLAEQVKSTQEAFEQIAVKPLQDLAGQMKQRAQPQSQDPALPQLKQQSDRVQQDLQALRDRLQAVAQAGKESRRDADKAMRQFQQELTRQNAELAARDLGGLKDFLQKIQKEMKGLLKEQNELVAAEKIPSALLDAAEKKLQELNQQSDKKLDQTRRLLNTKRTPNENKDATQQQEFRPALGGPPPKPDPRFEEPPSPERKKGDEPPSPERKTDDTNNEQAPDADQQRREQLRSNQRPRLRKLDQAAKSLASDEKSLEKLIDEVQQASPPREDGQQPRSSQARPEKMAEVMQSERMRQAQAMLQRLREMLNPAAEDPANDPSAQTAQQPPSSSDPLAPMLSPLGNLTATGIRAVLVEAELADLDPAARTIMLKMQPKMREQLLQGLREEGPEGYRDFIRNYFRRLSKVKAK